MKKEAMRKVNTASARCRDGKIKEGCYVEINGTKQWITVTGTDLKNPVMLHLHGGPGAPTSGVDYAAFREIADRYTVVSWDQRNCGKSRDKAQDSVRLTPELFISDALAMTQYLLDRFDREKLTLFGLSWGSLLGANAILRKPELFDAFIASGLHADWHDNEADIRRRAMERAEEENDRKRYELAEKLDPNTFDAEHYAVRDELVRWLGSFAPPERKRDLVSAMLFSPYYSLTDVIRYVSGKLYPEKAVSDFLHGGGMAAMSLKGRYQYRVPFYLLQGENDVITGYRPAKRYFDEIEAPDKLLVTLTGGHTSLMTCPGTLAECIDKINAHRNKLSKNTNGGDCV